MTTKQILFSTLILGTATNIALAMKMEKIFPHQKQINKKFLTASHNGNDIEVTSLLENCADINTRDEAGLTALHYAAKQPLRDWLAKDLDKSPAGRYYLVSLNLLDHPLIVGYDMELASGYYLTMETLLRTKNIHIDAQNTLGNTAAHYAAHNCDCDMLRLIRQNRGKLNLKNKYGLTPLQISQRKFQETEQALYSTIYTKHLTDKQRQDIKNDSSKQYQRCKRTQEFLQEATDIE